MTLENKQNTALWFRIAAVFVLMVIVFLAALFAPKNTSIPIDDNDTLINTSNDNSPFDVTLTELDQNQISNWKYWIDKHGTSKCHYHDGIYHLGTDCSLQQCYTDNKQSQTFDNQLILETNTIWNKQFIKQIHDINGSLSTLLTSKTDNLSLKPIRMDLTENRGENNQQKIILDETNNVKIYWIHMALEYFCCYTKEQYDTISIAMKNFKFKPFDIAFDRYLCIGEGNMNIVLFADAESQEYLSRLTDRFEEYLRDEYRINIHSHRRDAQPFHVTLLQFEESALDQENERYVVDIVEFLNNNYHWEDIKVTVGKSSICMNDKEKYGVLYECFE